jgi:hypothetical protein
MDAANRTVTEVHFGQVDAAWQVRSAVVEQDGLAVSMTMQQHTSLQWPDGSGDFEQTYTFEGMLSSDGRTLEGTFVSITNGDPSTEISALLEFERQD